MASCDWVSPIMERLRELIAYSNIGETIDATTVFVGVAGILFIALLFEKRKNSSLLQKVSKLSQDTETLKAQLTELTVDAIVTLIYYYYYHYYYCCCCCEEFR